MSGNKSFTTIENTIMLTIRRRLFQVNAFCLTLFSFARNIHADARIADKKEYNKSEFPLSPKSANRNPIWRDDKQVTYYM